MEFEQFKTMLDIEQVKSILIENIGVWDAVTDAETPDHKYKGYKLYTWAFRGIYFILGEGKKTGYYTGVGFINGRTAEKLVKRLILEDRTWIFRKLLMSTVDRERLKLHDARAYIPFAILGTALAIASLVLGLLRVDVGFQLTAVSAIGTALLYGLHRYGVSEEAIDIRFFAISLEYVIGLYGVPATLVVILCGSYIPLDLEPWLYGVFLLVIWVATNVFFFSLVSPGRVQVRLKKIWSRIRKKMDDDETLWRGGSKLPVGVRLGNVGTMRIASAYGTAYTMTAAGVLYNSWRYVSRMGYLDSSFAPYLIVASIGVLVMLLALSIDYGFIYGLVQVQELFADSIEISTDEDGRVMFLPLIDWNSILSRLAKKESSMKSILRTALLESSESD